MFHGKFGWFDWLKKMIVLSIAPHWRNAVSDLDLHCLLRSVCTHIQDKWNIGDVWLWNKWKQICYCYYSFHGDGGFYIPVFPLTPLPAPPSYNVAVSGAYSNPAFEPATMEQTTFQPPGWSPGPELDRSTEYNSEISHCYMRSTSGIPPDAESIVVRPNTASL